MNINIFILILVALVLSSCEKDKNGIQGKVVRNSVGVENVSITLL